VIGAVVGFAEPGVLKGVRQGKVVAEQEPEFWFALFGDEDEVDFAKLEVVWWGSGCEGECELSGSGASDWDWENGHVPLSSNRRPFISWRGRRR